MAPDRIDVWSSYVPNFRETDVELRPLKIRNSKIQSESLTNNGIINSGRLRGTLFSGLPG